MRFIKKLKIINQGINKTSMFVIAACPQSLFRERFPTSGNDRLWGFTYGFLGICFAIIFVSCFYAVSAEGGNGYPLNKDLTLLIHGLGYPPIKAQSTAQARLMAKRAATIDAYRNALVKAGFTEYNDESFYSGISGFVSGMTVLEEEYLKDGGIRITALVQVKNITVNSATPSASKKPMEIERNTGPSEVELNEWYKLIEKIVIIEKQ